MDSRIDWQRRELQKVLDWDEDAELDRIRDKEKSDPYPNPYAGLCGVMGVYLKRAMEVAKFALDRWEEADRRKDSLEWAAETVLKGEEVYSGDEDSDVFELLYRAADVVNHAIKGGMDDDTLRTRLRNGLQEDELKHGRFISDDERCSDCGDFMPTGPTAVEVGKGQWCDVCADEHVPAES